MTIEEREAQLASFVEMFSSVTRIAILKRLQEKRMRMAHLAKDLGIPIQEVHRNTLKLMETGLVQRGQDSLLTITDLGIVASAQLQSLEFMSMHRDYFKDHTLLHLPERLLFRIAALRGCSIMNGTVPILEKIAEMYEDAAFVKAVAPQVPLDHVLKLAARAKDGMSVSYIFGHNTIVPKGRSQLLSSIGWAGLIRRGLVKRRMAIKVHIGLVVTNKEACILFPHLAGDVDAGTMFYGRDTVFLKWCEDLFDELWASSHDFNEAELQET